MNLLTRLFGEGTFLFKGLGPGLALGALAGAALLLALAGVVQVHGSVRSWIRKAAASLRLLSFGLLLLVLMEPVLRRQEPVPRESFLAHLVDTSESMGIADLDGASRLDAVRSALASATKRRALDGAFRPLHYAFDERLQVSTDTQALLPRKNATDLAGALTGLQGQVGGLPLAGVVLYSDGNPSVGGDRDAVLAAAARLQLPIYAIGSAPREPAPDFWIDRVIHPDEVVASVGARLTVLVGAHAMAGRAVELALSENGREIQRQRLQPAAAEQILQAQFALHPSSSGMVNYQLRLIGSAADAYPWNDDRDFSLRVRKERRRLLYVEGSPRYEYRFLRAAFEADERFQLSAMVFVDNQSAVYRQGLAEKSELQNGFPQTEEELFAYNAVVIGDVPASRFSPRQMELLRDFVRLRGGGLLLLAGSHSFASGGYAATPLADVLPFALDATTALYDPCRVVPTAEGLTRGLFGPRDTPAAAPWMTLPPLMELYPLGGLKPGAIRLCEIDQDGGAARPPVVVYQRYGQGVSVVCGISATWPWKFRTPSSNTCYAAFWKELALILFEQSEGQLRLEVTPSLVSPGGEVTVRGAVLDTAFKPDPAAAVTLTLQGPDGVVRDLTPQPELQGELTFRCAFKPQAAGPYRVVARGGRDKSGQPCQRDAMFNVRIDSAEMRQVHLNEPLLRQLAASTGGQYLPLSDYARLPGLVKPRPNALQRISERTLWDHPALFILLLGLLLAEWVLRRTGGMA